MQAANQSLIDRLPHVRGGYREGVQLSNITWFGVGGAADVIFRPSDTDVLASFLCDCPKDIPIHIMGVGSNMLVRDGGIKGVTIRLGRGFTHMKKTSNETIEAGAACMDFNVALFAKEQQVKVQSF